MTSLHTAPTNIATPDLEGNEKMIAASGPKPSSVSKRSRPATTTSWRSADWSSIF